MCPDSIVRLDVLGANGRVPDTLNYCLTRYSKCEANRNGSVTKAMPNRKFHMNILISRAYHLKENHLEIIKYM